MLWIDDELSNHRLDYTYVSIERTSYEAAKECHPKRQRESNDKERGYGANAAHNKDRFAT